MSLESQVKSLSVCMLAAADDFVPFVKSEEARSV